MAKKFLKGTIIGTIIGAIGGLLLAPKSGKATRADIKKGIRETQEKTVHKAGEVREAAQNLGQETKWRGKGLLKRARGLAKDTKAEAAAFKRSVQSKTRKLK